MKLLSALAVATKLCAVGLVVASLSACVIAPIGPQRGVVVQGGVVVEPAPVVVVQPAIRFGFGWYGGWGSHHYRH
jgi:hypothetical protein